MKDERVDLCGELGHEEEDDFPVLQPEQLFEFACNGCGDCCRGREDIVLSGYDLYRICAHLRLPPVVVIRGFCRHYIGRVSGLPVVRLRPVSEEHNNCPFLYRNRCAIHEAEPLVCALYPLGQQIDLNGTVTYFVQPVDCGGTPQQAVCRDYLARYQVQQREPMDVAWALGCVRLSKRMKALRETLSPAEYKLAGLHIYRALYLKLDTQKPYQPQLENALGEIGRFLDRLEARKTTGQ